MKANKAEQQALISILNRIYGEIRAIEEEWDIRVDANDYRARIEYFHDAVRAMTSSSEHVVARTGRLSIEFLAYDLSMLRYIQANPMKKSKGTKATLSPSTQLVAKSFPDAAGGKNEMGVKYQLADLYKNYAVLFAALLCDTADRNYYNRTNECNAEVEELATLEQMVKSQKKDTPIDLEALVDAHIDDPDLMKKIIAYVQKSTQKKKLTAQETQRALKEMMDANDKEIKTVEKAHFTYVTSQLAVYENAREVVKKMATQGMNIVGSFVQNAVHEATRGGRAF